MPLVVPSSSDELMMKYILNKVAVDGNRKLKLFSNNISPFKGIALADINEVSASGYTAKTLTGSSWTVSTVSGVSTATYPVQTFSITQSTNVYGYYVTTSDSSAVLWMERFDTAPFNLPSGGGDITVTLNFTLN